MSDGWFRFLFCTPLKVGITGGIGSGKTTVCQIFELLNVPVYYADQRAKELMVEDPELRRSITRLLGNEAYHTDGSLNRKFIAGKVFNDPPLLEQLNELVHPAVAKDGNAWHARQKNTPYTLKEAALLFEAGTYKHLDKIIVVHAPRKLRVDRVMQRDEVTREEVEARMDRQWPAKEKVKRADFVILNDEEHLLIPQVLEIHDKLIQLNKLGC